MVTPGLDEAINKLYHQCPSCGKNKLTAPGTGESYKAWNASIMQVIEQLQSGKLQPTDLNIDLFRNYKDAMLKGAGKGFKTNLDKVDYDSPDYGVLSRMKSNLYTFAGAKTFRQLKEINELLYDSSGKLVPLDEFKNKASRYYQQLGQVDTKFADWLTVEYNTAIAQGTKARQWQKWMDNIDIFPNLRYRTVGDSHVRPAHARLDGVVVQKGSAYCDQIIPVKDFGCRCDMEETDEGATENPPAFDHDGPFEGNVGKNGIVISKRHPYYPEAVKDQQKMQNRVDEFARAENIERNRKIYDGFTGDNNYVKEYFDQESGGFLVTHVNADTRTAAESAAIDTIIANGDRVVLPELAKAAYSKSYDLTVNESPFEIKSITGNVKKKVEQRINDATDQAGNVILYFDKKIDKQALKRGLGNVKDNKRLNTILIIVKDIMCVITKRDIQQGIYSGLDAL